MVLRARQRREAREFQNIERQFALDDLDVADDALLGVSRKAQYVAAISEAADLAPGEEHLAVIGDAVLLLLRADEARRIDVLEADEDASDTRARRLLDEVRDLV